MPRERRVELIQRIQQLRGSNVVVYVTSDRPNVAVQIAEDAVRFLYEHLSSMTTAADRVDFFLYSRGGNVSVPWRVVTMFREFSDHFSVLIPYKAHSAATMIALGADEVVMGKKAELGPIDPTLTRAAGTETGPPPEISVEDVSSYISFMRERAGITDQSALAQVVSQLAAHLTPLTLGSVNRQYSHIRLVARKLLTSRKEKLEENKITTTVDALTEKMYSHGHAIGRKEAEELGLPVTRPTDKIEEAIWDLYREYEDFLNLNSPFDTEENFVNRGSDDFTETNIPLAVIESVEKVHICRMNVTCKRRRQLPPNPQININVTLPGINPAQLPANIQAMLQQLLGQILPVVQQATLQELTRQSPIIGIETRGYGGKWYEETPVPVPSQAPVSPANPVGPDA